MHVSARITCGLIALVVSAGCAGGGTQQSAMLPSSNTIRTASSETSKEVPAFFNGQLFSVFIKPLSPIAAAQILAKNKNLNKIYEAPGVSSFIPVIDDLQAPGFHFNPLWQVIDITFNNGVTPFQFTSATDIVNSSQITLTPTNQVDTVPVVGPKR